MPPHDHDHDGSVRPYSHLPIPTYDEAISSRPSSSQAYHGSGGGNDEAESQGLLNGGSNRHPRGSERYKPPTAESPRNSEDSDLHLPEVGGHSTEHDRRQIEELDYLEPGQMEGDGSSRLYHRARLRSKLSQRWNNFSATLSNLRLPRLRGFYSAVPDGSNDEDVSSPPPAPAPTPTSIEPWLARVTARIPPKYRLSGPTVARLFALFMIGSVVYVLFAFDVFPNRLRSGSTRFDPESVRTYVQEHISDNGDSMESWLRHITSYDHVAGTKGDFVMAEWMKERWAIDGGFDDLALMEYFVYLNYPETQQEGARSEVSVHAGNDLKFPSYWRASLQEGQVDSDKEQPLVWHGHSKEGSAVGHLIYANGGSREDFQWLQSKGVEIKGSIALIRYGATQSDPSSKLQAAEKAGCAGVLMFSDPAIDGTGRGAAWPDGPWRPDDSVQREGVALKSWVVGDPLTPGWASSKGSQRIPSIDNPALPNIPSIPLAWRDARVLLQNLTMNGGFGVEVPKSWRGGDSYFDDKIHWFSGAAVTGDYDMKTPVVSMSNHIESNEQQPIWNLHGLIEGMETANMKIVVGNNRDSWCFGAVDGGSGSAVLLELVSIFSQLRKLGWRPLRTIEFVSWDASEFNLMGSTEYVEDNADFLRDNGVAYLNVGAGVYGPDFHASGSPLLQRPLMEVLDRVSDPKSNNSKTIGQLWKDRQQILGDIGATGDSVAFQDIAGMSSLDFGFKGEDSGYPSHSCYETADWMMKYGDPDGLPYHRTLAQIWALLILELSDRPLIPFNMRDYAEKLTGYIDQLSQSATLEYAAEKGKEKLDEATLTQETSFTLDPLRAAAQNLADSAGKIHEFEDEWVANVLGRGGFETAQYAMRRFDYNNRLAAFDTWLLDIPDNDIDEHGFRAKDEEDAIYGVPGRDQFKHVIFGPSTRDGRKVALFPAITDAIEARDWNGARAMTDRVAKTIERAARRLVS